LAVGQKQKESDRSFSSVFIQDQSQLPSSDERFPVHCLLSQKLAANRQWLIANCQSPTAVPEVPMSWTNTSPISIVIAAPTNKAQSLYSAFSGDARFAVAALATSPADLNAKLALRPRALILDGMLYDGPDAMLDVLSGYDGVCLVLLPVGVDHTAVADLEALPCVAQVMQGEVDFSTLTGKICAELEPTPSTLTASSGGQSSFDLPARPAAAVGWRAIAVWNLQGGVGRSTVAAALALEAAARRLPTLLVGLGAPDPLPLSLGLRADPNLSRWRTTPTAEGLKAGVQSLDGLDLIAGFPSPLALTAYAPDALDGAASLSHLASTAAHAGYAVVIFDVSAAELAPAALAAANTLVLVGLATLPGILSAVESVRLASETLGPRHRLPPQAIHLVLNRVRAATFSPEEVVQNGSRLLSPFPPLAAAIRDDPAIEEALNLRRPAYYHSDTLRQAARAVGDLLFAPGPPRKEAPAEPGKVYTLGPLRVRM
jgi:arsenite-transporting ATPase